MKIILEANNISKSYKKDNNKINIINNLNISIFKGEIVLLMGPSGSGKSTLLNILGTLDTDYQGEIFINNNKIINSNNLSNIRSDKLGFIFQFHHLLPEFTVWENIRIAQIINKNKSSKNNIDEMLELVGMNKRKKHYPDELSGGEKQRVAVVRALINNPSIILADEPTGNLDRENSNLLLNLIVNLRDKYQLTFLIATHDSSLKGISDKILYLKDGKINKGI